MINKFSLAKALYDNAKFIADNNGYNLVAEMESYTSDPNEAYLTEAVLYGPDNTIGLADCSNDIQLGIYQINIYTPKANQGAKWQGLQIGGVIQAGFSKGTQLTHNDQMVRIKNTSLIPLGEDDTHLITILSINYSIIS